MNAGPATTPLDPRVTPARPDLAAAHLAGRVTAARFVDGQPMRVVAEATPVRGAPDPSRGYDTQALFGEAVVVYEFDDEGWAWVQLARDGYVGYVSANDLAPATAPATHVVRVPRTLVYPAASIKTAPLMGLSLLATVCVSSEDDAFARIEGGGFVWRAHLAPMGTIEPDFVTAAEGFEGAPYLWGGKTWQGLDCSGLVQIALQAAGIEAPRDTDMQARALGRQVETGDDFSNLRRGDLVFWKGHVGLMCDATTLLHASGAHMQVTREPFADARARIVRAGAGDVSAVRRLEAVTRP